MFKKIFAFLLIVCFLLPVSGSSAYAQSSWTFNYTGTIVTWTVPLSGTYRIEVWGAAGGDIVRQIDGNIMASGGKGARMRGDFTLPAGKQLRILIGSKGENMSSTYDTGAGGGGGTFIAEIDYGPSATYSPLIIAGGGGGANEYYDNFYNGQEGLATIGSTGSGGAGGDGGDYYSGGGGGFYTDGKGSFDYGGKSFLNGGGGGTGYVNGGFSGGGGTGYAYGGGGGGGYDGGQGGCNSGGGYGGKSYNDGINHSNSSGVREGNGYATINLITFSEVPQISSPVSGAKYLAPSLAANFSYPGASFEWQYSTNGSSFTNIVTTSEPYNWTIPSSIPDDTNIYLRVRAKVGSICGPYSPSLVFVKGMDDLLSAKLAAEAASLAANQAAFKAQEAVNKSENARIAAESASSNSITAATNALAAKDSAQEAKTIAEETVNILTVPLDSVVPDGNFSTKTFQNPYLAAINGSLEFIDGSAPMGGSILKHTATGNDSYTIGSASSLAGAREGEVWTASIYVKADTPTLVQIYLVAQNSSSGSIVYPNKIATATNEWQKISVTTTMPANTAFVGTRVDNDGGTGKVVYWDGWELRKISLVEQIKSEATAATAESAEAKLAAQQAAVRAQEAFDKSENARIAAESASSNSITAATNAQAAKISADTAAARAQEALDKSEAARSSADTAATNAQHAKDSADLSAEKAVMVEKTLQASFVELSWADNKSATTAAQEYLYISNFGFGLNYRYKINNGTYSAWQPLTADQILINLGSEDGYKQVYFQIGIDEVPLATKTQKIWKL